MIYQLQKLVFDPCGGEEAYCIDPCARKEAYCTDLCEGKGYVYGCIDKEAGIGVEQR